MFDSFMRYQALIARQFERLQKIYSFHVVDGDRSPEQISEELQRRIESVMIRRGTAQSPGLNHGERKDKLSGRS
jgi:dTMP kinase